MKRSKLVCRALAVIMAAAVTMSTATTLPVYAEDNIEASTAENNTPTADTDTPAATTDAATDTNTTPASSDANTVPTTDTNATPFIAATDTTTSAGTTDSSATTDLTRSTDTTPLAATAEAVPAATTDTLSVDPEAEAQSAAPVAIAVQTAPVAAETTTPAAVTQTVPVAAAETAQSTTETTTETKETNNDDGTKTTVTVTTKTTTTPGTFTTTEVKEGDPDYHMLTDENGDPILDSNGNKQYTDSKTVTEGNTVETTTTTDTTTTQETTTTTDKLTNAEDATNKTVYTVGADGNQVEMTEEDANKVKDFLNDLNVTSDFAIYADTLKEPIDHEDGNIAVNELDKNTTVMNKEGAQYGGEQNAKDYALDGYSYIGNTTNGAVISTSSNQNDGEERSTLVVGNKDNVIVNITEESGTANHFDVEKLDPSMYDENGDLTAEAVAKLTGDHAELSNIKEVIAINKNLDTISEAGEAITSAYETAGTKTVDEDVKQLVAATDLLTKTDNEGNKIIGKDDVLSIDIGIDTLKSGNCENTNLMNNNDYLSRLINNNTSGAKIIINVLIGDGSEDGASVTIDKLMNGVTAYDGDAAHLVWNFGDYAGTVKFTGTVSGVIVAPKASVSLNAGIQSGRIVAKEVSQNGEIHMAVTGNHQTTTTTTTTVKSRGTSTSTSTRRNEGTVKYTYKGVPATTPTDPTTPDVPVTPETPDVPVTPDTPVTPETPVLPETPETPSTPSTPETPSNTETPSTPSVDVRTSVPPVSESKPAETVNVSTVSGPQNLDTVANVSESNAPTNASTVGRSAQTGDESQMDLNGTVALSALASLIMYVVVAMKRRKKADKA